MTPLAERMRPKTLEEYVGQEHILAPGMLLRRLIEGARVTKAFPSLVFWGPPGTGKTTLAKLLAQYLDAHFEILSATSSGVKDLREVVEAAKHRGTTVLFVDEIHRFNKGQQDALLPSLEDGTLILVGATTENPSFELNRAILSRVRVFVLEPLREENIVSILKRALLDEVRGVASFHLQIEDEVLALIAAKSFGDARAALNALEWIALRGEKTITREVALEALQKSVLSYDVTGEDHHNLISALHKTIRAHDPQAALYYLARMLEGGEDPLYIARRLVRVASEDVGLADPQALSLAIAAKDAAEFVGLPECDVALAQATVYLALAPKSVSVYEAIKRARAEVRVSGPLPVPMNLRNAPTKLMKDLGYSQGYQYDPDVEGGVSQQETMPPELKGRTFYRAKDQAFERELLKRLDYFEKLRKRN